AGVQVLFTVAGAYFGVRSFAGSPGKSSGAQSPAQARALDQFAKSSGLDVQQTAGPDLAHADFEIIDPYTQEKVPIVDQWLTPMEDTLAAHLASLEAEKIAVVRRFDFSLFSKDYSEIIDPKSPYPTPETENQHLIAWVEQLGGFQHVREILFINEVRGGPTT